MTMARMRLPKVGGAKALASARFAEDQRALSMSTDMVNACFVGATFILAAKALPYSGLLEPTSHDAGVLHHGIVAPRVHIPAFD